MRYDPEWALAAMVADYLNEVMPSNLLEGCTIVAWYDPQSIDEADRIVVMIPAGDNYPELPANGEAIVEIGVRTRWTQATIQADFERHHARVRTVRDKLYPPNLMDLLNAQRPAGIALDFVQPKRTFETRVMDNNWIYSETGLTLNFLFVNENE